MYFILYIGNKLLTKFLVRKFSYAPSLHICFSAHFSTLELESFTKKVSLTA